MVNPSLSVIIAVQGRYESTEDLVFGSLEIAKKLKEIQFVFAFEDASWKTVPLFQMDLSKKKNVSCKFFDKNDNNKAVLFNRCIQEDASTHLIFIDSINVGDLEIIAKLHRSLKYCLSEDIAFIGCEDLRASYGFPYIPTGEILYDWMLYEKLIPLSYFVFTRKSVVAIGGFDTSKILDGAADWDFLIRIIREFTCVSIGADSSGQYNGALCSGSWLEQRNAAANINLIRTYLTRPKKVDPLMSKSSNNTSFGQYFLRDYELDHIDNKKTTGLYPSLLRPYLKKISKNKSNRPIRIAITGGFWEYAHNWLCFYNYLDSLSGTGFATYKILLEQNFTDLDILDIDIVIVSRGRSNNLPFIIDSCRSRKIPVVYMIDDNWFSLAADWPEIYGESFSEASESYRNFLYGIKYSDVVLTYSDLLAADARKYANRVITLPNSVDLAKFEKFERPQNAKFVVGYAGTPRYTDEAFQALAKIGRRADVEILLMGVVQPAIESMLAECDVTRVPYQSYGKYISSLRRIGADILLAPLDNTRTSRSKCPNKFLEITAAGAVGVYTQLEPYVNYIEDGINGSLVPHDASSSDWERAISGLLDKAVLDRMHSEARTQVANKYDVPIVAKLFKEFIIGLAR